MANRLHVATRKGLFELAREYDIWEVTDVQFLGDPVSAVLADADGTVYAALVSAISAPSCGAATPSAPGRSWPHRRFRQNRPMPATIPIPGRSARSG